MNEFYQLSNYNLIIMRAGVDGMMHAKIRNIVEDLKESQNEDIVLLLETAGGLPMYAYRTMKLLDAKYKTIICVIHDMSMSAGTLMALGADAIYMHPDSCLGPLDLQIPHPNPSDDMRISTLDVKGTAASIAQEAAATTQAVFRGYRDDGMRRSMAKRMAVSVVTPLYSAITQNIDPYHMHESMRNAELSIMYGARLLVKRMLKGDLVKSIAICNQLANQYSDHGYAITSDEAMALGLKVLSLENLDAWKDILQKYNSTKEGDIIGISMNKTNTKDGKNDK